MDGCLLSGIAVRRDWKVMIVSCSLFHTAICCKKDGTSHICSGPGWDASVFYEHEKNVSPH